MKMNRLIPLGHYGSSIIFGNRVTNYMSVVEYMGEAGSFIRGFQHKRIQDEVEFLFYTRSNFIGLFLENHERS